MTPDAARAARNIQGRKSIIHSIISDVYWPKYWAPFPLDLPLTLHMCLAHASQANCTAAVAPHRKATVLKHQGKSS
eukprot:1158420-Pelagomonas_calceolata.AAC.6